MVPPTALETHAVVQEDEVDSLMEQVHALTQEAVQNQEAVWEALTCTDLHRMQDVLRGLQLNTLNTFLTSHFYVTHCGGCAVLFNKDTFHSDINVPLKTSTIQETGSNML